MSVIVLDTNFIISCIKQKIDFFEELASMGFKISIPDKVIKELEKLKRNFELSYLEKYKDQFKIIKFKKGYVDKGMIEYGKTHVRAVIATLDSDLKSKLKNRIMVIRGKKRLEVI